MCVGNFSLCTTCLYTDAYWDRCPDFFEFVKQQGLGEDVDANHPEWVKKHGVPDPTQMLLKIKGTTCANCITTDEWTHNINSKGSEIARAIGHLTKPLAGNIEIWHDRFTTPLKTGRKKGFVPQKEDVEVIVDIDLANAGATLDLAEKVANLLRDQMHGVGKENENEEPAQEQEAAVDA